MKILLIDVVTMLLGTSSLVLHVLGIVWPGWWVLEEEEETFYFGILTTKICINQSVPCKISFAEMKGERAWLMGPVVLMILAALCLLVSALLNLLYLAISRYGAAPRKLCVLISIGAGAVIALAVVIFVKKKAGLRPSSARETSHGSVGWPLYLSVSACIMAVISGCLTGVCVARHFHHGKKTLGAKTEKDATKSVDGRISVIPLSDKHNIVDMRTKV